MRSLHLHTLLAAVSVVVGCADDPLVSSAATDVATANGDSSVGTTGDTSEGTPGPGQAADASDPPEDTAALEPDVAPASEPDDSGSESVDAVVAPICVPMGKGCEALAEEENPSPGKTQHPIVLVHGMGGFAKLGPIPYFVGVADELRALGFVVFTTVTDAFNGSDVRAAQLGPQLDHILACTCATQVNLIGHSQGGIDARVLVDQLGYGDRVAAVVTVATPHAGSAAAETILTLDPKSADPLVNLIGGFVADLYTDPLEETNVRASLSWCTAPTLDAFAKAWPQDPRVTWFSYAGRAGLTADGKPECEGADLPNPEAKTAISAGMLAGWTVLGGLEGQDNDGLVTVASAKYGHFRGCVPADHMQEIGLTLGAALKIYDHLELYREIAGFLASEGF